MAAMFPDHRDLIARIPGCARLSPEAMSALAEAARVAEYGSGEQVLAEGEPVPDWYCVVAAGAIEVSRRELDAREILDRLGAGDVLDPGTPGLPAVCSVVVTAPTRCLLLPQSAVSRHRGPLALAPAAHSWGDVTLFVRRAADLVKAPPVTCGPDVSVATAARLMTDRGVGSVAVVAEDGTPLGIVTDRDLRTKVVARGLSPEMPAAAIMSAPILSVAPASSAFDALLEMTRRGIHHMGVVGEGRLVGVISSHDIVLLQGAHPVGLMRQIEGQESLAGLASVAPRVVSVVRWLAEQGATAHDMGRIVTELNDRIVRRALSLVEASLEQDGHGRPPVGYAWLAGGSEGRREQTLRTDQDNGLVHRDPPPDLAPATAAYFVRLATAMREALVRLGFPACDGGFMAANPRWCQPESVWRRYFASWMETPEPGPVLSASLFFDLRPVAGEERIGSELWEWVCERAPSHTLFLRYMARAALERHVPLGLFGGFVVERSGAHKDQFDLKARGTFPVTQSMRVCALSIGARETNTVDRLLVAAARGLFDPAETRELRDAYEVISRLRLHHQIACLDAGLPPDNFLDPKALGATDRILLKQAFKAVARLQRHIEDRFQPEALG
jgi:CBS domain-containing protein